MHLELPIGAFTAALLVLIPLPWHWRSRNIPTLSIIGWLFFANIIYGVNAIIWAGNVDIVAQVWCDIVTKFQIGATMGLPACCLCLCIHLERIASVRQVSTTSGQKQRRVFFDILMCWGLPLMYMALHYIVQGHRYDIIEDFGCRPTVYVSIASIFIIWVPPLVLVVLTSIYAALALIHFFRRRVTFGRHLQNSNSALTTSRYFRLMAMAMVQIFWGIIVMSCNMWFTCRAGLRPWTGWADVHSNFSRVDRFPTFLIPMYILRWTYFIWWTIPISSVLFFAFFSFGEDALKEYAACISWIARVIFRRKQSTDVKASLPQFIRTPVSRVPVPTMSMSTTADTKSTQCSFDDYKMDTQKQRSASFDVSSSFIATPSSITSFPSDDSCSTFVVPSPSTHTSRLPEYSSRADEHA